jgi:hypothetical protein
LLVKNLNAFIAAVAVVVIVAAAAAQSGSSAPTPTRQPPAQAQVVTAEQTAAMWIVTCRVQCPGDANVASAVSCQRTGAGACRQVAARNSNCRADLIPASWCASRALPSAGD